MNKEQLIQNYISNRLSEKDKATVERMLETDIDFKAEFESHKEIAMAFKVSEAKTLKDYFQKLEEKSPKRTSLFNKYRYLYLAIASIIVIGLFYTKLRTPSGNELYDSNFDIYPNTYQPVIRSGNSDNSNKAFVAYENGDFITAENELELLLKVSDNPNIRFYLACSLLNQSKFDLALKEFETLNTQSHNYKEESLWYTALIEVKKEDYTKAIRTLDQLNTINSKFKSKERKLLLQKLNKS